MIGTAAVVHVVVVVCVVLIGNFVVCISAIEVDVVLVNIVLVVFVVCMAVLSSFKSTLTPVMSFSVIVVADHTLCCLFHRCSRRHGQVCSLCYHLRDLCACFHLLCRRSHLYRWNYSGVWRRFRRCFSSRIGCFRSCGRRGRF